MKCLDNKYKFTFDKNLQLKNKVDKKLNCIFRPANLSDEHSY